MKLLLPLTLLQLLSYAVAECPQTFSTTSCSLSSILETLGDSCDLGAALGGLDDTNLEVLIKDVCDSADLDKTLDWTDVTKESGDRHNYQWDSNYFDGGTSWNNEKETSTKTALHNGDAGDILRTWNYHADNKIISWPTSDPSNNRYGVNFEQCDSRVAMCCFTGSRFDDNELPLNADVCHHDLKKSKHSNHVNNGFAIFDDYADKSYCTGFSWDDDDNSISARYKGNALFYASLYSSLYENGFVKNIPSSPLCACVEQMATVTHSDCVAVTATERYSFEISDSRQLTASFETDVGYGSCQEGNDLVEHYRRSTTATADEVETLTSHHIVQDCAVDNLKFANNNYWVPGSRRRFIADDDDNWTLVVGKGDLYHPPIGETAFRAAIEQSPNKIIRRVCPTCSVASHRDIYYKRLTAIPPEEEYDFLANFMDDWFSMHNVLGVDFMLYSSYEDAVAGVGGWTYCNYDIPGIGFPRDCGPTRFVPSSWNSFRRTAGQAVFAFYVEKER